MAIFFGGEKVEAVLFSPLEGKLTFEGKPAVGAKIELWIKWKDSKGETFTYTTDNDGYFKIPEHRASYRQVAIAQLVIVQKINVQYNDNNYLVWNMSKMDGEIFGELGGKPINLVCEITSDLTTIRNSSVLGGIGCEWDAVQK